MVLEDSIHLTMVHMVDLAVVVVLMGVVEEEQVEEAIQEEVVLKTGLVWAAEAVAHLTLEKIKII